MDARAAKLALARKKLKDHQEKKHQENSSTIEQNNTNDQIVTNNEKTSQIPQTSSGQPTTVPQPEEVNYNFNQQPLEVGQNDMVSNYYTPNPNIDVNATEILVASKRNLELQINVLQAKILDLENQITTTTHNYDTSCQKIIYLENELRSTDYKYHTATEHLVVKDASIKELSDLKSSLLDQNSNLKEQLEFTKSILTAKESENDSLHTQLFNMQNQLDAALLQMQQLTNGVHSNVSEDKANSFRQENEALLQKISNLEQQLKVQIKDYQQLNNHYEHYVEDLNNQLKQVTNKNAELTQEIINLSNRENSLIEQISDMEIRLQNYKKAECMLQHQNSTIDTTEFDELRSKYEKSQQTLADLSAKYADLQNLYAESKAEIDRLRYSKEADTEAANEHTSLLKLNADITSDKIAAQRATEQNKKLKQDIQGLEDVFVKMTKDKLDLTEKITAEKFLNRELTIKLAEIEEKANDMQKKLKAKDEEMIRLQTSCRIIEEKYSEIAENLRHLNGHPNSPANNESESEDNIINKEGNHTHSISDHSECQENNTMVECKKAQENAGIPNSDAMVKLQERFLKIMDEVADLSDEKHRLEHIITQLQNETDTICEYVALYQQQRCLLKKRDEERTTQMKMFQSECTRLQNQLNELTGIITRFAEDAELSSYFQVETKHADIQKVMKLLSKLKTNSLVDPQKSVKFNDSYPCSCCSGQLIEV